MNKLLSISLLMALGSFGALIAYPYDGEKELLNAPDYPAQTLVNVQRDLDEDIDMDDEDDEDMDDMDMDVDMDDEDESDLETDIDDESDRK